MHLVHSIRRCTTISLAAVVGLSLTVSVCPTWARSIRVRCADGAASARVSQAGGPRQNERVCDLDQACDGACTFGFCGLADFRCAHDPACVGPRSGVCALCECPDDTVVVPAGGRRDITDPSGVRLSLRCQRKCAACRTDVDCDDWNGCSLDRCVDRRCTHDCLCVAPGNVVTCCPGPALVCPRPTPCGPDLSCDSASEMCVSRGPVGPSVVYACDAVPAGCETDRTCACAGASLCQPPFDSCRDAAKNEIFCECLQCQ
jgi:hypothetical protein